MLVIRICSTSASGVNTVISDIENMYSVLFIAGVEINNSYFPCIIVLIMHKPPESLAKHITEKSLEVLLLGFESHLHNVINTKFENYLYGVCSCSEIVQRTAKVVLDS